MAAAAAAAPAANAATALVTMNSYTIIAKRVQMPLNKVVIFWTFTLSILFLECWYYICVKYAANAGVTVGAGSESRVSLRVGVRHRRWVGGSELAPTSPSGLPARCFPAVPFASGENNFSVYLRTFRIDLSSTQKRV
jgi:hypothetical protein